jgi:hypothetical protein
MPMHLKPARACVAVLIFTLLILHTGNSALSSEASRSRVEAALNNIAALQRPGQDGIATFWDGNKYVQCRRIPDQALRCESAGTLMQPSLGRVVGPERIARLIALVGAWTQASEIMCKFFRTA